MLFPSSSIFWRRKTCANLAMNPPTLPFSISFTSITNETISLFFCCRCHCCLPACLAALLWFIVIFKEDIKICSSTFVVVIWVQTQTHTPHQHHHQSEKERDQTLVRDMYMWLVLVRTMDERWCIGYFICFHLASFSWCIFFYLAWILREMIRLFTATYTYIHIQITIHSSKTHSSHFISRIYIYFFCSSGCGVGAFYFDSNEQSFRSFAAAKLALYTFWGSTEHIYIHLYIPIYSMPFTLQMDVD